MTIDQDDAISQLTEILYPAGLKVAFLDHSEESRYNYGPERETYTVYQMGILGLGKDGPAEYVKYESRPRDRKHKSPRWPLQNFLTAAREYVEASPALRTSMMFEEQRERLSEAHADASGAFEAQAEAHRRGAVPPLLSKFTWDVESTGSGICLVALEGEGGGRKVLLEVHGILGLSYHDRWHGDPRYTLQVDDGVLRLRFETRESFEEARIEMGLRVVTQSLKESVERLNEKVAKATQARDLALSLLERAEKEI